MFVCLCCGLQAAQSSVDQRLSDLEKEYAPRTNPDLSKKHVGFVTAEYLFWNVVEEGLAFAVEGPDTDVPSSPVKGKVDNLDFEWDSGFRVGLGYRTPRDRWEFYANWAHFNTDASGDVAHISNLIYPQWTSEIVSIPEESGPITSLSAHWDVHLNVLDGEVARYYPVSHYLSLKPHVGVRAAWIDQHYNTHLFGGVADDIQVIENILTMRNDFRGVGLRGGLDTEWTMSHRWSLFANAGASLLYGAFHISRVEDQQSTTSAMATIFNVPRTSHQMVGTADLALGVRLDHTFKNMCSAVRLELGWEYNNFFGQNKFPLFLSSDSAVTMATSADLTAQGLVFSGRFDY
ncbi:MAG TPA: Lpg1974 family pore-forming outer membrane protein [Chlamydiales bacterium]|nr:Lpg1974 family pore-forming outer membrane protein [Chlamydiales bacterium]